MGALATTATDQFALLGKIATEIELEVVLDDSAWAGSPFEWLKKIPSSRTRGKAGEMLVERWCQAMGLTVERSPDSECDRVIEGHRIEIKMSTLWATGDYRFSQIREQDYSHCLCLGISPFAAHGWLLPKAVLRRHVIGHMGQHTGGDAAETSWLGFDAASPLPWMRRYGGSLDELMTRLARLGR